MGTMSFGVSCEEAEDKDDWNPARSTNNWMKLSLKAERLKLSS